MLPDRVSNPGPLTYESGALPIALRGPASVKEDNFCHLLFASLQDKGPPKWVVLIQERATVGANSFL